jgi:hypothetical protein
MTTANDPDLRALFAPLTADAPTAADRAALRTALATAPAPPPSRLTWKPVAAVASVTLTVGIGLAVLPASDSTTKSGGVSILHAAAAEAAGEPVPGVAEAPYRYAKVKESFTYTINKDGRTAQHTDTQVVETWVTAKWRGRVTAAEAGRKAVTGDPGLGRQTFGTDGEATWLKAGDRAYAYGDGPLAELDPADLPSDRDGIAKALRDGVHDNRWSPYPEARGKPERANAAPIDSFVTYSMVNLLTTARVTPAQRAAMLDVLSHDPAARDLGTVSDRQGRSGRGVALDYPGNQFLSGANHFTIVFDPETSEILEWSMSPATPNPSAPARTETVLGGGYVAAIGDRP